MQLQKTGKKRKENYPTTFPSFKFFPLQFRKSVLTIGQNIVSLNKFKLYHIFK